MDERLFAEIYGEMAARSGKFDRVWYVAVKTTGVFCRMRCPARTPLEKNVEFLGSIQECLHAGYRPCKRCRPMTLRDEGPEWVDDLVSRVQGADVKLRDGDLRDLGLEPATVRRHFLRHFGMSFHTYQRAWRMGQAIGSLRAGGDSVDAAMAAGYASESGFREAFERIVGVTVKESGLARLAYARWIETPIGGMVAVASEDGLGILEFVDRRMLETELRDFERLTGRKIVPGDHGVLDQVQRELAEYFEGERRVFGVDLDLRGTAFQVRVWRELAAIPWGEVRSYGDQARVLGQDLAVRAVGRANGMNRLAIVVPCHRVIGSDGSLTGYGGGLWRKKWLLTLEGVKMRGT